MVKVENIGKGTYFDDAYKLTFRYDTRIITQIKSLAQRRYLPEERAWEIPVYELGDLTERLREIGVSIEAQAEVSDALKEKQLQEKREATRERLKGIKPVKPYEFITEPLPHQIEAFNVGQEKRALLIGDQQGLGKTKEAIDITVSQRDTISHCLIVCGVNSVKYNWAAEIRKHSKERAIIIDGKTMDKRVNQINDWYKNGEFFGIINIESLRNEKIQDALYVGIKDGIIGATIVDEIHKAKNGNSQQGKTLRILKTPVKIGLTGTPIMSKAEDLWNILVWLEAEKRNYWQFRNAYCVMGGYGGYKVVSYKNLDSLNGLLNTVMLRRTKEEVLDLPPKVHQQEYVELTRKQQLMYKDIRAGIIDELEEILTSVNPLTCTLRLRQLTGGLFTEDNPKLDRIKDMLSEEIIPNGEKAIIFSQWEKVTEIYRDALSEYNPIYITGKVSPAERQKEVERFQTDPECKLAIGTIGAMGTGLTLNRASYVFFVDKAWTAAENEQAEDRAHRIGTQGTVTVISMLAINSVDEGIEDYLADNKDLFDRVVDGKGTVIDYRALLNKLLKIS
jgi:SNF2 family DNA or RNA helicase